MPLTLHHGPAGENKTGRFLEIYGKPDESKLILVPDHLFAEKIRAILLAESPGKILMGTPVLPFEDWLFKLVKRTFHRAHRAEDITCRYLIFLLFGAATPPRTGAVHAAPLHCATSSVPDLGAMNRAPTTEIFEFITAIKCAGLHAAEFLKKNASDVRLPDLPDLPDLITRYQQELLKRHHFDTGDLYFQVMTGLQKRNLSGPEDLRQLFITGIYPLHAGHRKILRQLKSAFPSLHIHVFYDEDHNRPDDLLSQAYVELGELCDHEEFIANDSLQAKPTVIVSPNPFVEAQTAMQEIQSRIAGGMKPEHLTIVTNGDLAFCFESLLEQANLPFGSTFAKNCGDILPQDLNHTGKSTSGPEISALTRTDSLQALEHVQVRQILADFSETRTFLQNLFQELQGAQSEESQTDFFAKEFKSSRPLATGFNHKIALCDLNTAIELHGRTVFLTGLNVENLIDSGQSQILSLAASQRSDLAELTGSPAYRFQIRLEKIKKLISQANTCLSASDTDTRGAPLTVLPGLETQKNIFSENTHPATKKTFPLSGKNTFSLSEIETYLDCPYKYYADRVLKLGKIDDEDIVPPADIAGTYVHQVLHGFFTIHQEAYIVCLGSGVFSEELKNALAEIAGNEVKKNPAFQDFHPDVVANLIRRTRLTLAHFLSTEISWHGANLKKTVPRWHEWTLRDATQKGLPVHMDGREYRITARVDRIDVDEESGTYSVIDYKTGSTVPNSAGIKRGESLQLPFYTLAIKELHLPQYEPSAALYYLLGKKSAPAGLTIKEGPDAKVLPRNQISLTDWHDIEQNVLVAIKDVIRKILEGRFAPEPRSEGLCRVCSFRRVCAYHSGNHGDGDTDD